MSEREKIRDILDTGGSEIGKPRGLSIINFYLMGLKHNGNFQLCNKYCIILYHVTESVLIFISFCKLFLCLHEGLIIINFTPLLYLILLLFASSLSPPVGSVYSVAAVLMTFLRSLREPVVPRALHQRCTDACNNPTLCKQVSSHTHFLLYHTSLITSNNNR